MMSPSPQQRWQAFRANHLPYLNWRQKLGLAVLLLALLVVFILFVLPYLLGLGGPDIRAEDLLMDADGAFVEIDGERLYYVHAEGDSLREGGAPVLLIHGFNGATVSWRQTIPALTAAGFEVYALDMAGFGLSEKSLSADLSHPTQADRVAAFLDTRNIPAVHVVAHSMGGNVALHLAERYPGRVLSLTLISPILQTSPTAGALPPVVLDVPAIQRWSRILIRWIIPATVETQLLSAVEDDRIVTADMVADHARTLHTPDWDLALLALARDSQHNTLTTPLSAFEIPVLLLWGEEDGWNAPALGEDLSGQFPHADLITFPAVGHLPMDEAPSALNAAILEFLELQTEDG